jgi:hypothetical protein
MFFSKGKLMFWGAIAGLQFARGLLQGEGLWASLMVGPGISVPTLTRDSITPTA